MNNPWITAAAIILLGGLFVLLPVALHTFQRYRRKKVVKCPETGGLAEVNINAPRAAISALFSKPLLRVKNCSLWPKRQGCREGCLKQ